jgi:FkbM family methyltransferase
VLAELYENTFGKKDDGLFVEVGAFNGEFVSNTCFLADMGWEGVYLEPNPKWAELCSLRHRKNNVKVLQGAAGNTEGSIDLYDGEAFTTSRHEYRKAYAEFDYSKNSFTENIIKAYQQRLDTILTDNNILPDGKHIDLLVVDVEGAETEVFEGFDNLEQYRPTMMIVELEDLHPQFKDYPEIIERNARLREYILSLDYHPVYQDDINTVFVT